MPRFPYVSYCCSSKEGYLKHVTLQASLRPEIWPAVLSLVLASLITTGCSRSHSPKPVERDPCLDAGPANTTAYNTCMSEREERKAEALRILLSDDPADNRQRQLAEPGDGHFQLSDFPDEPMPASFRMPDSLHLKDTQAFPYKTRISWKYVSDHLLPSPKEYARMMQMDRLIQAAVAADGSAKWGCTVTGGQRLEWVFYTLDDAAFVSRVQAVLAQTGPYPVEFSSRKQADVSAAVLNAGEIRLTPKRCLE
ncbi:hypothetical protein ABIA54_000147 [Pseudomonas sp. EB276 TE3739]